MSATNNRNLGRDTLTRKVPAVTPWPLVVATLVCRDLAVRKVNEVLIFCFVSRCYVYYKNVRDR